VQPQRARVHGVREELGRVDAEPLEWTEDPRYDRSNGIGAGTELTRDHNAAVDGDPVRIRGKRPVRRRLDGQADAVVASGLFAEGRYAKRPGEARVVVDGQD